MTLMEGPGILEFEKVLRIGMQVNILEEDILKSMRRIMEEVQCVAEVEEWNLSGSRTPSLRTSLLLSIF